MKVLIHAADAASLERARSNARNLIREGPDAEIEIVVNAGAVAAALDAPDETDDHLVLCSNTLKRLGREPREGLVRVPAAIVHLVRRQEEGWAYVRA
ncbi:hypothetical protein E3C22_15485 [Jiella endophytica]|uniref:Intracellular sulfur oxidation protein, DsrE/DsrF family n=1 Tax=Jiella endophytica TaxID=2558362 RepID=A0A4Y8RJP0_9HYPH|nr:hypothetical protein [Jiella endophytica]TFF22047.1 hypothetical protein E3C22_15485 [Jiella endophytica]